MMGSHFNLNLRSRCGRWRKRRAAWQRKVRGPERLDELVLLVTLVVNTHFDGPFDPNDELLPLREAITVANDEAANLGTDLIPFDSNLVSQAMPNGIEGFDSDGEAISSSHGLGELVISSELTLDTSANGVIRIGLEYPTARSSNPETSQLTHCVLRASMSMAIVGVAIRNRRASRSLGCRQVEGRSGLKCTSRYCLRFGSQ